MSDLIKRAFGIIFAKEDEREVTLRGVKVEPLARDIAATWGSKRVERNMFTEFSRSILSFDKFFAPDFHYMLRAIKANDTHRTSDRVISKALVELETETWLKNITIEHPKNLDHSKTSLFNYSPLPHQVEFFNVYEQRKQQYNLTGYLLSAAAGSGKTLTCLMLAEMLHADLVIMVVPKNAVYKVWSRHLNEEYKKPQEHWIAADKVPYEKQRFLITHYEALEATIAAVKTNMKRKVVVILDESHNMNESDSNRTQRFIELCHVTKSEDVLWSSGTPVKALGSESIPLLRTIDPLFTPEVEAKFRKIFGGDAKRALDILRNRMGLISFRVEKTAVVDNKATTHTKKIKMPNGNDYTLAVVRKEMKEFIETRLAHYKDNKKAYEKIYNEALEVHRKTLKTDEEEDAFDKYKEYIKTIRTGYDAVNMQAESKYCNNYELKVIMPSLPNNLKPGFKNARSIIKYPELKVLGEALGSILGRKRVKCHLDMIPYMNLGDIIDGAAKKTVIFSSYVEVVQGIEKTLKSNDYDPVTVYGDTNKDLTGLVTRFETKPEANPMVATYQSMSTAVPLIVANCAVFTNSPFRDHELTQARARVDRLGQDTPVEFWHTTLDTGDEPNVSTRAKDILEWSREQVAAILGKSYSGDVVEAMKTTVGADIGTEEFTDLGSMALEYYCDDEPPLTVSMEEISPW